MINNRHSIRVRKYAAREMIYNNSQHAIYGVSYVNTHGKLWRSLQRHPVRSSTFIATILIQIVSMQFSNVMMMLMYLQFIEKIMSKAIKSLGY